MDPSATTLSDVDRAYLESCLANYTTTPSKEKEAFRMSCAKHIITTRGFQVDKIYLEFFHMKVRNWFQNRTRKSHNGRFPLRVHDFSGIRAFAHLNAELIRTNINNPSADSGDGEEDLEGPRDDDDDLDDLDKDDDLEGADVLDDEEEDSADADPEDAEVKEDAKAYIVVWNATVRRLWHGLSADDRLAYERLAEKWTAEGPDDDMKPLLAAKKAPAWMRSVSIMFWTHCNMPIFIYGMYKDSAGGLHAAVYDTSNLWHEKDKSAPLLRNVPGWDEDFRRTAWNFFQATLRPDLASAEQLQLMQASKREPAAPFAFDYYDDGCPILVDQENGKAIALNWRRQEIFRDYMRIHYKLAAGQEKRSAPWKSMGSFPDKFFEPGMLPPGFAFQDPSKINEDVLIPFFTHVRNMEAPPGDAVPPKRFRFYQYEMGPPEKRTYHAAVYNGIVEPLAPRRAKKTVTVPEFEGPPPTADGASRLSTPQTGSPAPDILPRPPSRTTALVADFEAIRAQVQAERLEANGPAGRAVAASLVHQPRRAVEALVDEPTTKDHVPPDADPAAAVVATSRPRRTVLPTLTSGSGGAPSDLDSALRAAGIECPSVSTVSDDDPYVPEGVDEPAESDDEVEGVLNLSDAAADVRDLLDFTESPAPVSRATSQPADKSSDIPGDLSPTALKTRQPSSALPVAPADIPANAADRLAFLEGLADDRDYVSLLSRIAVHLENVVAVRAQAPVFWGTWGHKSPHVPEAVQTNEKRAAALLQWVRKDRAASATSVEVQRFCIVVGITLRDLSLIASADAGRSTPAFMSNTFLTPGDRASVLEACANAFLPSAAAPAPSTQVKRSKAKRPARGTAPDAPAGPAGTSVATEEVPQKVTQRRSQRIGTRRS